MEMPKSGSASGIVQGELSLQVGSVVLHNGLDHVGHIVAMYGPVARVRFATCDAWVWLSDLSVRVK